MNTKPITLDNIDRKHHIGKVAYPVTLTPVDPPVFPDLPPVYLVTVPEETAISYGCSHMAGKVVGGVVKVRNGWCAVAYENRDDFIHRNGKGYHLPVDARTRRQAVRMLLFYWHIDRHPDWTVEQITEKDWKRR